MWQDLKTYNSNFKKVQLPPLIFFFIHYDSSFIILFQAAIIFFFSLTESKFLLQNQDGLYIYHLKFQNEVR
jgi:hypothetical protein